MNRWIAFYKEYSAQEMKTMIERRQTYIHPDFGGVFLYEMEALLKIKEAGGVTPACLLDSNIMVRRIAKKLRGKI